MSKLRITALGTVASSTVVLLVVGDVFSAVCLGIALVILGISYTSFGGEA